MEKEIIINQGISNEVEQMVLLAQSVAEVKSKYPKCWAILRGQFDLGDSSYNFIADDLEIVKLKLYAEILSRQNLLVEKAKKLK